MDMRVRLTELMEARGLSAYQVAIASGEWITMSTIYRLKKADGRMEYLNTGVLEALCDVFRVGPGELLERDTKRPPATPSGKPARPKAKRKAA